MMKKIVALAFAAGLILTPTQVFAGRSPMLSGAASALVPGLGQIINNDQATWKGRVKIATMLGLELGGILATPALAKSGFPEVMIGVGMLAVNHVWSAVDAYRASNWPEVRMNVPPAR